LAQRSASALDRGLFRQIATAVGCTLSPWEREEHSDIDAYAEAFYVLLHILLNEQLLRRDHERIAGVLDPWREFLTSW
jgi:hypothetical protein